MALSMGLGSITFANDKAPDRERLFGQWLDNEGFVTPGPKIKNWIDSDKDRIDDRLQAGAGQPAGKPRPELETGGPDPRPEVEKPGKPDPVAEYKRLELAIVKKKEFATRAKFNEDGFAEYQAELRAMETRLAELKKVPEVVICIFPPPRPEHKPFPPHWGRPPAIQTKDIRPLPKGFEGMGSSTLCAWIERNVKSDLAKKDRPKPEPKRPPVVRPPAPPRPEFSDETKAELAGIKSDKKGLMEEMKAKLSQLGDDASREDARKAVEEFKKDNEARFAAIKEAADKVHEELKAKRPERKERPEPPAAVKAKIAEVKKVEKTLHVARKAVSNKLKEAQDELAAKIAEAKENANQEEVAINIKRLVADQATARKAALDEFRTAQKEKHEELKAAQKELRKEVRNTKEEGSSRTSR